MNDHKFNIFVRQKLISINYTAIENVSLPASYIHQTLRATAADRFSTKPNNIVIYTIIACSKFKRSWGRLNRSPRIPTRPPTPPGQRFQVYIYS